MFILRLKTFIITFLVLGSLLYLISTLTTKSALAINSDFVIESPDSGVNGQTIDIKTLMPSNWQNFDPEIIMLDSNNSEVSCRVAAPNGQYRFFIPNSGNQITLQIVQGAKRGQSLKSVCDHQTIESANQVILQQKIISVSAPNIPIPSPSCALEKVKNNVGGDEFNAVIYKWNCNKDAYLSLFGPKHTNEDELTFIDRKTVGSGACNEYSTLLSPLLFKQVLEPNAQGNYNVIKGIYILEVRENSFDDEIITRCTYAYFEGPDEVGEPGVTLAPVPNIRSICNSIDHDRVNPDNIDIQPEPYRKCVNCVDGGGIWTAVGCINTDISGLISDFFTLGMGIGGGIALLFFIYGGFLVLTSQGNAEQVQQGREIITSAIAGLLLIIFSLFIFNLIVNGILKIPIDIGNPSSTPTLSVTPTPADKTYCCTTYNFETYQCPFGQNSGTCSIELRDGRTIEGTKCNTSCSPIATPIPSTCEQNGGSCKPICGIGEEQKVGNSYVCSQSTNSNDTRICCVSKPTPLPEERQLPSANSWNITLFIDGKHENLIDLIRNKSFLIEPDSQELRSFNGKVLTTLSVNLNNVLTIVNCKEITSGPLGEPLVTMNIPEEVTLNTKTFPGQINIFASYNSCPEPENYNNILTTSSLQKTKDIQFNLN